jgi:hypothetical protein
MLESISGKKEGASFIGYGYLNLWIAIKHRSGHPAKKFKA